MIVSPLFRLKRNLEERPKTYLEILELPAVKNVTETPSADEKAFINRVIDSIPPYQYQ